MKKFFAYLSVILFSVACSSNESAKKENNVVANTKAEFTIDGMTCPHGCAAPIESKLSRMEGVSNAKVDFESKTAVVSFDNSVVKFEDFKKKIESLNDNQYAVTKNKEENVTTSSNSHVSSSSNQQDFQDIWKTDFELPNVLDFFTNII